MSKSTLPATVVLASVLLSGAALAGNEGKIDANLKDNEVTNGPSGKIIGQQEVMLGKGVQNLGQLVISAGDSGNVKVTAKNNKITNNGVLQGSQKILGGSGTQNVGQVVVSAGH